MLFYEFLVNLYYVIVVLSVFFGSLVFFKTRDQNVYPQTSSIAEFIIMVAFCLIPVLNFIIMIGMIKALNELSE